MPPAGSPYASPYSAYRERNPLPKVEDPEDDKQSTMSRASGVPRAEHALDALRLVAGNRVRHARCAPEFLEEIATRGVQDSLKQSSSRKFKIINGSEARTYFKNYILDHKQESEQPSRTDNDNDKITNEIMPSPIVFAVTVWDGRTKCVDYYMTWRGKTDNHGKAFEQRVTLLDSEFRRLAKGLDKEYKHISSLRTFGNLSRPVRKTEKKFRPSHSSHKSRGPPGILVSTPEESLPPDATQPPLPEPPVSATDSVMSLPLLNMVRNVPFSHRVPLRVTNPDRLSLISESDVAPEELKNVAPPIPDVKTKAGLSVPVVSRSSKRGREDAVHGSSASIRSTDTKSSKSSRSSRSSSRSENRDSSSPPDRHKGNRDSSRSHDHEIPEFLIVLLGDRLDTDANSWHGLERQTSIRSLPADRHSPWVGPVAHSELGYRSTPTTPNGSDDESDDEVEWKHTPVIPMKPLMEAMGIIHSSSYYHSPPVVPGGLQYQLSIANASSPAPSHSPYLYGSPRLDSTSYVPAWLPQLQMPHNSPSRPVSRAYSSASYGSPYMQSHTGPF
ncbi:hypothetical protein GALMADRAFT_364491 [Galerina marginata CBS 339.88]|uniref:Uncharacterized protein n=1 Tax=Galerina marginata (strain CBS 339.88) TaxID=685588 RepID=A0A067TZR7_GALM3|nr:hypothetical protein GALMADRAFT_364491 [Galerina marginata CBS 339.88]